MPTARFPLLCALTVGFLLGLTDSARPCPRESAGLASEEGDHSAASVSLLVVNKHKKPVTLFWVNHKGAEVKQTEVSAGAEVTQGTFPGHAWRVRGAGQQKLLAEGVARGAVTRLVVERCGSSHSKSVYGFPVSKAWRESKAEKAANAAYLASDKGLLSHPQWSGCALDRALADATSVSQPGFHVLCTLPLGAEVEGMGEDGEGYGEDGDEADGHEAEVAPMRKKWAARVAVVRDGKVPEDSRGAGAGAGAGAAGSGPRFADIFYVPRVGRLEGGWAELNAFLTYKLDHAHDTRSHLMPRMGLYTAQGRRFLGRGGAAACDADMWRRHTLGGGGGGGGSSGGGGGGLGGGLGAIAGPSPRAVFVFEAGNWIWPGVREGFEQVALLRGGDGDAAAHGGGVGGGGERGGNPGNPPPKQVMIRTKSLQPLVLEVFDFLDGHEADHIIERSRHHVAASGVSLKDADKGKEATVWRTSHTYFLAARDDDRLNVIEARVQSMTRLNISHAEHMQVLRYDEGGHYMAHNDFFDPKDYRGDAGTMRMIEHGAKNRLATVFFYLNDVPAGGHTGFPRAGGLGIPMGPDGRTADYGNCNVGIKVKPDRGKVIIFYSLHADASLDHYSLHGGCDVKEGVKWSANFWLWNKPLPTGEAMAPKRHITALKEPLDRAREQLMMGGAPMPPPAPTTRSDEPPQHDDEL